MTNAAALTLQFFVNPSNHIPALFTLPAGPIREAADRLYEAFFLGAHHPKAINDARFCEKALRELGRAESADQMAAIARLISFGANAKTLEELVADGLAVLTDRDGTPVLLARRKRPRFGLRIPASETTGLPDIGLALSFVETAQNAFLRKAQPICPVCFRLDHEHDDSCPMHVPVDPTVVDTHRVGGVDAPGARPSTEGHVAPCPFCGASGRTIRLPHEDLDDASDAGAFVVRCGECGMYGPEPRPGQSALEAWNQRHKVA